MAKALRGVGVAVWLGLSGTACLVTADLRTPAAEEEPAGDGEAGLCGDSERYVADTGCVPCIVRLPPPETICPCAWERTPAAFPYCDGPADYHCLACAPSAGPGGCTALAGDGSVRDCAQLAVCCGQIAQGPSPCCPAGQSLVCYAASGGEFAYAYGCVAS